MVVAVEARKLSLNNSSTFPPRPSSLLFDPTSLSLAILLPDSSLSILSPFPSPSPSPSPQTLIPSPSSSFCFLNPIPNPNSTLFIAAGPSHDASRVLLRFFLRSANSPGLGFVPARVRCGQSGLHLDRESGGAVVDCSHGLKVVLAGSGNYFAMYSASSAKVWVFGVKLGVGGSARVDLRLVKSAVIDCRVPVTCISVSCAFLILGEVHGVRVFCLRSLVKGSSGRKENGKLKGAAEINIRGSKMANGVVGGQEGRYGINKSRANQVIAHSNGVGMAKVVMNGFMGAHIDGSTHASASSVKPKSQRLSQDSKKCGASFVPFNSKDEGSVAKRSPYMTKKAISIHGFSQNRFLVADSDGIVHILCASVSRPSLMKQLTDIIEVQHIAVLPDSSESSQTVWLSDGYHTVHVMTASDTNTSSNVNKSDTEDLRLSVVQTIFVSENIRDVQPLSPNAILILGQDNLYTYAIS